MDEKNTLNDERIEEVSGGLDPANNETAQEGLHELKPLIGKDSEEFLEKVSGGDLSGGPLNAYDIQDLDYNIALYKKQGSSLETMLSDMKKYHYSNESMSYVKAHW